MQNSETFSAFVLNVMLTSNKNVVLLQNHVQNHEKLLSVISCDFWKGNVNMARNDMVDECNRTHVSPEHIVIKNVLCKNAFQY